MIKRWGNIAWFFLLVTMSGLTMANGKWHEKAEREGQVPPELQPAPSIPSAPSVTPSVEGQPQGTMAGAQIRSFPSQQPKLIGWDWQIIVVAGLWLIALLFIYLTLREYIKERRRL